MMTCEEDNKKNVVGKNQITKWQKFGRVLYQGTLDKKVLQKAFIGSVK